MRFTTYILLFAWGALALPATVPAGVAEDIYWDESFAVHAPDQFTDAIVVHGNDLYVGGNFRHVDDLTVNYIARFRDQHWEKIGSGVGTSIMGLVHTIAISGNTLYAGGMFDQVGIWTTNNIARYDMTTGEWRPLGQGTNRAVRQIRVAGNGDVYVVGEFSEADGQPVNAIARFDGNQWHPLGTGLHLVTTGKDGSSTTRSGRAIGLCIAGNGVYVGGMFDVAGGEPCANIAYWDGIQFHPLGEGTNGIVTAMTLHEGQLYVGGQFTRAGGLVRNSIARWDVQDRNWHALGSGISGGGYIYVRSIIGDGNLLYVGGEFGFAGGQRANNIAVWDGSQWSTMGSGTNDEVKVITRFNDALYVGGNFTAAGQKPLSFMTRWVKDVIEFELFSAMAVDEGIRLLWSTRAWATVTGYRLYLSSGSGEELLLLEDLRDTDATSYLDTSAEPGKSYTYRISALREDGREVYSPTSTATAPIPGRARAPNKPQTLR